MKYLFLALRPQQWIKNLFIFLPLIFGKKLFVYPANAKTVLAFLLFSLTASVVYLINDIIDIEKDKIHPTKRMRPIASGKVSTHQALFSALVLGALAIGLSFLFGPWFTLLLAGYIIFNLLYSKILKDIVIVDVFCLGAFFLLRIIAGTIVAQVDFSHWMIFITVLLSFFLGFNKRRQELELLKKHANTHRYVLEKYSAYFIDQMIAVITSSIVVVYMLYTVDYKTISFFGTSHLTYSIPFVYYGIFRYLYLIHKKGELGDPVRILLEDRMMRLNLAIWISICIGVVYFKI